MATFRLEIEAYDITNLKETIYVHTDNETFLTLRNMIKSFLEARKYL